MLSKSFKYTWPVPRLAYAPPTRRPVAHLLCNLLCARLCVCVCARACAHVYGTYFHRLTHSVSYQRSKLPSSTNSVCVFISLMLNLCLPLLPCIKRKRTSYAAPFASGSFRTACPFWRTRPAAGDDDARGSQAHKHYLRPPHPRPCPGKKKSNGSEM